MHMIYSVIPCTFIKYDKLFLWKYTKIPGYIIVHHFSRDIIFVFNNIKIHCSESNISGISIDDDYSLNIATIVFELLKEPRTDIGTNTNKNNYLYGSLYIILKIEQKYTYHYFGKSKLSLIEQNLHEKVIEGLPIWSYRVPYLTYKIRVHLQQLLVLIEIGVLLWSFYQIYISLQLFIPIICEGADIIISPLVILVNKCLIVIDSYQFIIDIKIILTTNFNNIIYYIKLPFTILSGSIKNFIKLILQIKILTLFDIGLIYNLNKIFTLFKEIISIPIDNLKILLKLFAVIKIPINVVKQIFIRKNTIDNIEKVKSITKIKDVFLKLWNFVIKPVKHIYDISRTPNSGEIGRKVKIKYYNI